MKTFVVGPPWLRVTVTAEQEALARRLAPFFEQAGGGTGGEEGGPTLKATAASEIGGPPEEVLTAGGIFRVRGAEGEGWYDAAARRGEVALTPRSGTFFETYLRQVFLWESYRRGGLVLHAAAFAEGGDVIMSCGPSDSGKSTLAGMLQGAFTVYSDEMNVVDAEGRVWALPFRGTALRRHDDGGGRLRAFAFHRPGGTFRWTRLGPAAAARKFVPNVFVPQAADGPLKETAFSRLSDLARAAPAFDVDVPLEEKAAREGFLQLLQTISATKDGTDET